MSTNMSWQERSKPGLPMYKRRFQSLASVDMTSKTPEELEQWKQIYGFSRQPMVSPFRNDKLLKFLPSELFPAACDLHGLSYLMDFNSRQPSRMHQCTKRVFRRHLCCFDTYLSFIPIRKWWRGHKVNHLLPASLLENKRHDLPEHCHSGLGNDLTLHDRDDSWAYTLSSSCWFVWNVELGSGSSAVVTFHGDLRVVRYAWSRMAHGWDEAWAEVTWDWDFLRARSVTQVTILYR